MKEIFQVLGISVYYKHLLANETLADRVCRVVR